MKYKKWEPWLYLSPALIALAFVFALPVLRLIVLSVQRKSKGEMIFVGAANYTSLLKDDVFLEAVGNNLYLLISVPIMVGVALLLAIFLFEGIRAWRFYQITLFLPFLLPIVVVGLVFSYIFQLSGVLNEFLTAIGLGRFALDWLGSTKLALPTVMFVVIWKEVGLGVILFLARLMSVEEELFDAAKIDGANWWEMQWHITIPQLSMAIEFFTIISVITMLSWVFNYVFVITAGGPGNSTMVTELYVYLQGFRYNQMNLAAAASMLILAVTIIIIFIQFRLREGQAGWEEF